MNVYTYYQNIEFSGQNELIELWKKSWESKGFNAIVLGKEDAESHPFYNEFCDKLKKIHLQKRLTLIFYCGKGVSRKN